MARIREQIKTWTLNENKSNDGADIGGYQSLMVSNYPESDFPVTVRFDGNFKHGLGPGEDFTEQVDGANILVTIHPLHGEVKPGQKASGDIILKG